jgi:hypothetical protein
MPLRHHSLIAWQRADDLFIHLHKLARESFPVDTSERTAAIPEYFLGIVAEVGYCLHVARRLGYITAGKYEEFDLAVRRVGAPLSGIIQRARGTAS